jgi:hypothetical protein
VLIALTDKLYNTRQYRYDDYRRDHDGEVLFDDGYVPEKESRKDTGCDPGNAADNIIANEAQVGHAPDAGDKGGKGPDNRDKPGYNYRFASVFFVELVGAVQVFLI